MSEIDNNDFEIQSDYRKAAKPFYYVSYEGFNQTTNSHRIYKTKTNIKNSKYASA